MKACHESKLSNGLSVISIENPYADVVTMGIWINAGSRYESKTERGCAHILEHLLIKGTASSSPQQTGIFLDRSGAYAGAKTDIDSICIEMQVEKKAYTEAFALMAGMVTNPLLDENVFNIEKKVIIEEYHRFFDNRNMRMGSKSNLLVFNDHPLSQAPVGEIDFIERATLSDVRAYYEKHFFPNRMTLIVSGNVEHNDVVNLAKKYFCDSWQRGVSHEDITSPLAQGGYKFSSEIGTQTQLFFNYVCPKPSFRDVVGLEILSNTLGYGKFPLLKEKLRHNLGLVYSINVYVLKYQGVALWCIPTATTQSRETVKICKEILQSLKVLYSEKTFEEYKTQYKRVLLRKLADPFYEVRFIFDNKKYCEKTLSFDEIMNLIDLFTLSDMHSLIDIYLSESNLFITAFGEKDFNDTK